MNFAFIAFLLLLISVRNRNINSLHKGNVISLNKGNAYSSKILSYYIKETLTHYIMDIKVYAAYMQVTYKIHFTDRKAVDR